MMKEPQPPSWAPSPPPRRRGFAAAFAAFMEERNIFWGELIGAVLIVGCSVALIVTLWDALAANPLFKFCTFVGADALVTGAGLYTLRRWKLESASRGLLLIGLALAPVALLAMIVPVDGGGRLEVPAQFASLLVLGLLAYTGGRVLVPDGPAAVAAAVIGASACQLLAVRLVGPATGEVRFLLVGLAATVSQCLGLGAYLRGVGRKPMGAVQANGVFLALGTATFALAVTLGLLIYQAGDPALALGWTSMLLALAGLPVLAGGLVVHHGLQDERKEAGRRAAGTAVALAGMVAMLLAVALAWPRPAPVLAVCALNFAALTVVGFRARLPIAHVAALGCFTVAYLVGFYLVSGRLDIPPEELAGRLTVLAASAETGTALAALFVLFGIVGELLARFGRPRHGKVYALVAGGVAALSLMLVTMRGVNEPGRAVGAYALYGAGILVSNLRWRRAEATYLSLGLLGVASLWGLWWAYGRVVPEWAAALAVEGLAVAVLAALWPRPSLRESGDAARELAEGYPPDSLPPQEDAYRRPLAFCGQVVGWIALALAGWYAFVAAADGGMRAWPFAQVVSALALAALWGVSAVVGQHVVHARLASWLLLGAVVAAAGWLGTRTQVEELGGLIALCLAGAGLGMAGWAVVVARRPASTTTVWSSLLAPVWLETAALAILPALAVALASATWPWHSVTASLLAATAFLLVRHSTAHPVLVEVPAAAWTWVGATLALGALVNLAVWGPGAAHVAQPWPVALLSHATLVLGASLLLRARGAAATNGGSTVEADVVIPLGRSALLSSFLAVPLLLGPDRASFGALAGHALWLAALWLVMAWRERWPILFAGFQAALAAAVVLAGAVWRGVPASLEDLQVQGIGLAALSLVWVVVRRVLRAYPVARHLLDPGWPQPDRILLAALLLAQLILAATGIAPGVSAELSPVIAGAPPTAVAGVGAAGWILLAVLALALLVESWDEVEAPALLGLIPLALAVPALVAGLAAEQRAVASALRWGLGVCFLVCSVPLWWRGQLAGLLRRAGRRIDTTLDVSTAARWSLIACAALPVVLLTLAPIAVRLSGHLPAGPLAESFFVRAGRLVATVVPLVLVCVGLVGHALREKSPGYAFAVGLGLHVGLSLLLRYHHRGANLEDWWVYLAQVNASAAAVMALLWLAARRHLYGESRSGMLLVVQVAIGPAINALLLGSLALGLAVQVAGAVPASVQQGGGPWGWVALLLAGVVLGWELRGLAWQGAGSVGCALLAALAVPAACAAAMGGADLLPGFHALGVGWAAAAALLLAGGWREFPTTTSREGRAEAVLPAPLVRIWVAVLGGLLVALALREAAYNPARPAWPVGMVLAASALLAGMALWQRREGWALAAALGLNVAVSLIVWRGYAADEPGHWWVRLAQANVFASAAGAMLWLTAARRLHGERRADPRTAPLLTVQVALALLGSVLLLAGPALQLIVQPAVAHPSVLQAGEAWNWLALGAALAAGLWYARGTPAYAAGHVLGAVGLAVGVLAACTVRLRSGEGWTAYHVLAGAGGLTGAGLLLAGWVRLRLRRDEETAALPVDRMRAGWLAGYIALLAVLGLRAAWETPFGPWWPAGMVLVAGGLAAGLALWRGREAWMLAAGLAANAAVSLLVVHHREALAAWWYTLGQANVLVAAGVALAWLALARRLYGTGRPEVSAAPLLNLQVALALLGGILLLAVPAVEVIVAPDGVHRLALQAGELSGWLALLSSLAAAGWYAGRILIRGAAHVLCGLGLAVGVLAACTALQWAPGVPWVSYHTLMTAWVLTALATLVGGWLAARRRTGTDANGPRGHLDGAVLAWLAAVGVLVVGLALRAAPHDPTGHAWAAGAVLGVGTLFAATALVERREGWAFAAALALELAVGLVVWESHLGRPFEEWWVFLVQAVTTAGAGTALLWLAARRPLYGSRVPRLGEAPLLNVQIALPLAGNLVLVGAAAVHLIAHPDALGHLVTAVGEVGGWLALLAAGAAALRHLRTMAGRVSLHLVGGLALAAGVLAACTAGRWQPAGEWLAYHVLAVGWTVAGALLLAIGRKRWPAPFGVERHSADETPARLPELWALRGWLTGVGLLVLGLALCAAVDDPARPWWPAGIVLALGALTAVRAAWQRHEGWAFAAGLALNVAASLVLWRGEHVGLPHSWPLRLAQANVAACAVAALVWLGVRRALGQASRPRPLLTLQVALALAGNVLLLGSAAAILALQPTPVHEVVALAGDGWGWAALLPALPAAAWYFGLAARSRAAELLGVGGLTLGVLAASTVAAWAPDTWAAYHSLMTAWVVAGFVLLAAGWAAWGRYSCLPSTDETCLPRISEDSVRAWIGSFALLVVALALRAVAWEPAGPWWPAGAVGAVALLCGGVALWQRREGWAFAAGLALNLAVSLLAWGQHHGLPLGRWWVFLVQANVLASSAVAVIWLAAYRRFYPDRAPGRLLHLHVLLGLAGNAGLLLPPLVWLVLDPGGLPATVAQAGGPVGWLALLSAALVAGWHLRRVGGSVGLHTLCGLGLAVGVLAASSVVGEGTRGWEAYLVLTAAWAAAAFVVLFAGWRAASVRPGLDLRPVLTWETAIALLVVGLALRGFGSALFDPWGSVGAVAAVALLFCLTALWRQHEGWAVASGLAVNLAATLTVIHYQQTADWGALWTVLVQVNIISGAATTLIWLAVRRQRYLDRAEEVGTSPMLSVKITAELAANALLLVGPLALLIATPGIQHDLVRQAGDPWSWLALLMSLTAAAWRFRHIAGRFGVYVVCGLGLTLGTLTACTANHWDQSDWLSYHVLTAFWAATGLIVVAAGWKGDRESDNVASPNAAPMPAPPSVFPAEVVRHAVLLFNVLLLGLGLREAVEPDTSAWWPALTVLAVAGLNGMTAAWRRSAGWAFAAGLCVNVATTLAVWKTNRGLDPTGWWVELVQANVLAAALTALGWLAARRRQYVHGRPTPSPLLRAQVTIGLIGNVVLLVGACAWLIARPAVPHEHFLQVGGGWGWAALAVATGAALWHLGQTRARAGLHLLCGMGLGVGVLAASSAARLTHRDGWLAYHVLMSCWALAGAAVLAVGWVSSHRRANELAGELPTPPLLTVEMVRGWVAAVCMLVIGLALRGVGADPSGYFWQAGAVLAVSVLAGAMALWQRSDGWTFAAALGVNLAVSLLFWDHHTAAPVTHWPLRLAQVNLITGALTALLWLLARRLDRAGVARARTGELLALHVNAVGVGAVCLLGGAVGLLIGAPATWAAGAEHPPAADWVQRVGDPLGWLALVLAGAAVAAWARQRGVSAPLHGAGAAGLALVGQAACTVEAFAAGWGYRTLLAGWAAFTLVYVFLARRLVARRSAEEQKASPWDALTAEAWLGGMVVVVTLLALNTAFWHRDRAWAAGAIALTGAAAAAVAGWRRREGWAFLAGLGVNLAASLLVWDGMARQSVHAWWLFLVQVNVIAGSGVALAWLAAAHRLYGMVRPGAASLFSLQIVLCVAGNVVLLVRPAVLLIGEPKPLHAHVAEAGSFLGWLTLLLTMAAAGWYAGRLLARGRVHVLGTLGLALAVLVACTVANVAGDGWLAYRTLTVGWALTGAAALRGGWRASRRSHVLDEPRSAIVLPDRGLSAYLWVAVLAGVVLALGLRGVGADPLAPWWPAGVVLAVGALAAGLTLWRRQEGWALAAGLTGNLAVSLVLLHLYADRSPEDWWVYLVQGNALAASAAVFLWLGAARRLYGVARPPLDLAPLLALQSVIAMTLAAAPLVIAGLGLIAIPDQAPVFVRLAGGAAGWVALLAALGVGHRQVERLLTRSRVHIVGVVGLGVGVLSASAAAREGSGNWLPYHVLMASWGLIGLAVFSVGWIDSRRATRESGRPALLPGAVQAWVAALAGVVLTLALRGVGPDPAGTVWASGIALAVSATAAVMALWRRSDVWAFGAGLVLNLGVSLLLWETRGGRPLSGWWVTAIQANALASAGVGLLWMAARCWLDGAARPLTIPLLTVQVILALAGNALVLVGPGVRLVTHPEAVGAGVAGVGSPLGWLALLAALAAAGWYFGRRARSPADVLCLAGLSVGVLAACTAAHLEERMLWIAYHTLTAAWTLTAAAALAVVWLVGHRTAEGQRAERLRYAPTSLQVWVTMIGGLVAFLALREFAHGTTGTAWPVAMLLIVSALAGVLAVWSRSQAHVYASGLLACLAGSILLRAWDAPLDLLRVNALSLAVMAALWSVVEQRLRRCLPPFDLRRGWVPFSHVAALVATCALAGLAVVGVGADLARLGVSVTSPLTWTALAVTASALVVSLRDPDARFPLPGLYVLGLSAGALALHGRLPALLWLAGPLLAGFVLLATLAWRAAATRPTLVRTLAGDAGRGHRPGAWFAPAQSVLAGAALALSLWACLAFAALSERFAGPLAVALVIPSVLLAGGAGQRRRAALQGTLLALVALFAVEAGWALLDPGVPLVWLQRSGVLLLVSAPLAVGYGLVLARLARPETGWAEQGRRGGNALGALAVLALVAVLAQEALLFPPWGAPAALPPAALVVAVAAAVAVLAVTTVCLAVVSGFDPFGLSERGRTAYVYAAEVLVMLLFAHLRLTAPHLFRRGLEGYWPFLVLGLAFLGAAVAELFRRLRLRVLAEPLERTGVFLPMLPVLVFWVQPPGQYATVWFLVGLLYVFLSVTRRSLGFLLLAAVASNVGLWLVLHQNQLAFLRHPQLWVIPFALTALGAEHLNRDRLTRAQRTALRYLALTVIYLTSSAEVFLAELGNEPVRPLVLAGLSLLGVFAGMLLRVRAFLFLGSGFLLLGVFAVIRHAAHAAADRGRIVWLVAGIVLGVVIFTLFAVFEKRRNDVVRLLHKLKDWE